MSYSKLLYSSVLVSALVPALMSTAFADDFTSDADALNAVNLTASAEDCVQFNTANATLENVLGDWKIVEGSHWLFSFGTNQAAAVQALKILKTYQMTQSCFVGRPGPSFSYLLTAANTAPTGNLLRGEDCISFNPDQVQAELNASSHTWKMVQGSMWMVDFGDKKQEALDAVALVKKHKFNQQCFVSRPNPPFTYWKSTATTETSAPDLGAYGFMSIGKTKRLVKWNESIVLTPADAFMVSNGVPAFDIYYSDKNYGNSTAANYENQLFLDDAMVSRQYSRTATPGAMQEVHTQAYLKPSPGTHVLKLKVDGLNSIAEGREDNNLFQVNVSFSGF